MKNLITNDSIFDSIVDGVLSIDPVYYCEKYLTLDGWPFSLSGNGYKPFADIYRYIGIKALEPNAKPIVFVKGRQVGGTTMACALELYFMTCGLFGKNHRPPMRIMHCFPLLELGYMYTKTKLNTMIKSSKLVDTNVPGKKQTYIESKLDRSASSNDSMSFKQFENGNHLFIESTGLNADRIHGFTADSMFFDEVQNIPGIALANATKILSQSKYGKVGNGVQLYFGTPRQKGSEFHRMWMMSSRQYYHLGCEHCKEYFPLYTPESNDWEEIWIEDDFHPDYVDPKTKLTPHGFIVKCIHCGFEQDKRPAAERGKWIATNEDTGCRFVGYQLNQLFMPNYDRAKIISEKPENHPVNTERAYQNEVLGEYFSGEASPITAEQIHDLCADMGRKFRRGISLDENKRVYLGADWGQKVDAEQIMGDKAKRNQGQSYSAVVILSVEGPNLLSIEYAQLLKKNDPEYKKSLIDQLMRQYSVNVGCGDIGFAQDLTSTLQHELGDRFLASRAMGSKMKNHVKFVDDIFPKEIQFERNHFIEQIFLMMKKGQIRFPYGDYEKIGTLITHCTSMEMKGTSDRSGNININYVKGSTPNDFLMALINAYIGYLYDSTGGFKEFHPDKMDTSPDRSEHPIALLGYIPGMNPMKRGRR